MSDPLPDTTAFTATAKGNHAPALSGVARVFLGPPEDGIPHDGVRGHIVIDQLGVHAGADVEWLFLCHDKIGNVIGSEWEPLESATLIPWHRVYLIEWEATDGS